MSSPQMALSPPPPPVQQSGGGGGAKWAEHCIRATGPGHPTHGTDTGDHTLQRRAAGGAVVIDLADHRPIQQQSGGGRSGPNTAQWPQVQGTQHTTPTPPTQSVHGAGFNRALAPSSGHDGRKTRRRHRRRRPDSREKTNKQSAGHRRRHQPRGLDTYH